jgi:hypothetical protein
LVSIADAFAGVAVAFSRAGLGAFHDAEVRWPGVPETDKGGSIVRPGVPLVYPCQCQVDTATEAMRAEAGFAQTDVALLILAATLDVAMDTEATVIVAEGPRAGRYSVQSVSLDSMGSHWVCRGRGD